MENITTKRETIRQDLAQMSFEELQKLKKSIGTKLYNKTVFGVHKKPLKTTIINEKHQHKNAPLEISSKRPIRIQYSGNKKFASRDPRFDPMCGTFNEKIFKKSYKFLDDVKKNERTTLMNELKNDNCDPERQEQIKYLIQRMDNQRRERERRDQKKKIALEETKIVQDQLKQGEKPLYKTKSTKKVINLIQQYDDLKSSKQLKKHIDKKSKKVRKKDAQKMFSNN